LTAFSTRFKGRHRTRLTNETLFRPLDRAGVTLSLWKDGDNAISPHSSLGNLPPAIYAMLDAPVMQRDGTSERSGGSTPRSDASPSPTGSNDQQTLLPTG